MIWEQPCERSVFYGNYECMCNDISVKIAVINLLLKQGREEKIRQKLDLSLKGKKGCGIFVKKKRIRYIDLRLKLCLMHWKLRLEGSIEQALFSVLQTCDRGFQYVNTFVFFCQATKSA